MSGLRRLCSQAAMNSEAWCRCVMQTGIMTFLLDAKRTTSLPPSREIEHQKNVSPRYSVRKWMRKSWKRSPLCQPLKLPTRLDSNAPADLKHHRADLWRQERDWTSWTCWRCVLSPFLILLVSPELNILVGSLDDKWAKQYWTWDLARHPNLIMCSCCNVLVAFALAHRAVEVSWLQECSKQDMKFLKTSYASNSKLFRVASPINAKPRVIRPVAVI